MNKIPAELVSISVNGIEKPANGYASLTLIDQEALGNEWERDFEFPLDYVLPPSTQEFPLGAPLTGVVKIGYRIYRKI